MLAIFKTPWDIKPFYYATGQRTLVSLLADAHGNKTILRINDKRPHKIVYSQEHDEWYNTKIPAPGKSQTTTDRQTSLPKAQAARLKDASSRWGFKLNMVASFVYPSNRQCLVYKWNCRKGCCVLCAVQKLRDSVPIVSILGRSN
jgi:hypothetical protein